MAATYFSKLASVVHDLSGNTCFQFFTGFPPCQFLIKCHLFRVMPVV